MRTAVLRFAPSPNGRLHLGHAYSALLNQAIARRIGGRLLVRIEDIDTARSRPCLIDAMLADLDWLGLTWEEPVRRQSEHMDAYRAALDALRARRLVFPCFCSRGDISREVEARVSGSPWARDPDGTPLYPGTCRHLTAVEIELRLREGREPAWRLDTAAALATATGPIVWRRFAADGCEETARPERWGDPVVGRRDLGTSYHLSVVVDDADQGVTHVVRGADLANATGLHVLLQQMLGLTSPFYHHHRLLRDAEGAKLSKSRGSVALADLRAGGATPADIRRMVGVPG